MNFEQPRIENDPEKTTEEIKKERKSLSEVDKNDLSQVEQTKEFEELMVLIDRILEVGEERDKEKGTGILSSVGLNKKFKAADKEYEALAKEADKRIKELGKEIDMKEPFLKFFVLTASKKRIIEQAQEE